MSIFSLSSIGTTMGGNTILKFTGGLTMRLSSQGRLIMVGLLDRTLHDRSQRKPGGERVRLPSKPARQCRDVACAVVAARALGFEVEQLPPYEIDL